MNTVNSTRNTLIIIALGLALTLPAHAAVNSWIDGTGKWENTNNWSLGSAPLNSDSADLITNAGNNTITIDFTTAAGFPFNLTISNLTVGAPIGSTNALTMLNTSAFQLEIRNSLTISAGGVVTITNSVLKMDGNSGGAIFIDGKMEFKSGSVSATNTTVVGNFGPGSLVMSNGVMDLYNLDVGESIGANGTLTVAGGSFNVASSVTVGDNVGTTGTVWITGGQMAGGTFMTVGGFGGYGQVTLSNAAFSVAGNLTVGGSDQSYGAFNMSTGTAIISSLSVGAGFATGAVWITGGSLNITNTDTINYIGFFGVGQMTISNGTVQANQLDLGELGGSQGTLTIAGGQTTLKFLQIANIGSSDAVWVTGGTLLVTTNGSLTIANGGDGQMTISNGSVRVGDVAVGAQPTEHGRGTLTIAGGTTAFSTMVIGEPACTGAVWVTGGQTTITNGLGLVQIGIDSQSLPGGLSPGIGQMTVSNGSVTANSIILAHTQNGYTNFGRLFINGGTVTVLSEPAGGFGVGDSPGSTGIVVVTGSGQLILTNVTTTIGNGGIGSMTYSNGSGMSGETDVGAGSNSQGSLFYDLNSSVTYFSNLTAGAGSGSTAQIMVSGNSAINVPNGIIGIGNNGNLNGGLGFAQMTIANASVTAKGVNLGSSLGGHGIMTIQSGAILHIIGGNCNACGFSRNEAILDGGTIDMPDADSFDGQTHPGEFIMSNGVATVRSAFVGFDNTGTMTIINGTQNVLSNLVVGTSPGATGIVTMTGGSVFVTNGVFAIGNGGSLLSTGGVGHVTLSNGVVEAASILIGDNFGSASSLTVAGSGSVRAHGGLRINGNHTTTVNGGTLEVVLGPSPAFEDPILHDRIVVSYGADGTMIVSNGLTRTPGLLVGASAGNTGTLQLPGGITSVFSNMTVGFVGCASTGIVNVTGGSLYVTNGGTATLEIRSGTFTLSAGIVSVDRFVMTNACAHFVRTGGTLIYGTVVLDPNGDADGDGIPNGYELSHGLDPLNPADASADNDGDGLSNLQEFQAGTDPNNSASSFLITSVVKIGNDVRVTWMMGPGKTNALQWTVGTGNGSYQTNNFANLFSVTNTLGTVTNYLDVGGATNIPARYYRVRLVP